MKLYCVSLIETNSSHIINIDFGRISLWSEHQRALEERVSSLRNDKCLFFYFFYLLSLRRVTDSPFRLSNVFLRTYALFCGVYEVLCCVTPVCYKSVYLYLNQVLHTLTSAERIWAKNNGWNKTFKTESKNWYINKRLSATPSGQAG